jgi:metal-sulfur cluster biosynthetic enzyme
MGIGLERNDVRPNPSLERTSTGLALGPRTGSVIIRFAGQAPTRRGPLSSNFRPHVKLQVTTLLCVLAPMLVQAVERRTMCFSQTAKQPIQIEFATYEEANREWISGYVKFNGAKKAIGIVYQGSLALEDYPDHPSLFRHTWFEVRNGRIAGRYQITSQGAVVGNMQYKNYTTRRTHVLTRDLGAEADSNDRCAWR